jgi:hypothetical protein
MICPECEEALLDDEGECPECGFCVDDDEEETEDEPEQLDSDPRDPWSYI